MAPKPVTTSSALFPASVEANEGVMHRDDFMQDLSLAPQNFLSPLSSGVDHRMRESLISENAVLLSSREGDQTKKATELETASSVSKEASLTISTDPLKSSIIDILKSTESEKPVSDVLDTSHPISSDMNRKLMSSSVMIESILLDIPTGALESVKTIFSKSTESETPVSDALDTSKRISSSVNSELAKGHVSSSPETAQSLLPSSTPLAAEVSSPEVATSTKEKSEFETSSSIIIENASQVVNPSPSFQNVTSTYVEYTRSHILQSSFRPLTVSSGQKSTESLEIVPLKTESSAMHDEDLKKNSSRTRFLSLRRPSPLVKLNRFKVKLSLRHDSQEDSTESEDESPEPVTESNPAKVVFREATVTSEVTLHVGRRKSVRLLTITTSVPMTVHPTDISSMLDTEGQEDESNVETRTFTTTERVLKTSIVPVYDGKSTAYHKVTESFFIMKFITAYKTLPTGDVTVLDETSKTTLEDSALQSSAFLESHASIPAAPSVQNQFLSFNHALSNNPLAAVYLGLQQLNAQMTLYSTTTDTSTYVKTETFYTTKTVRFYDGKSNHFRTVSEPTSTKMQTIITTVTSIEPYINTKAIQQQQTLQQLIAPSQLRPQFETKTSIYTTKIMSTSLSTRVYTLIYNGFSTKFRTITSTTTYPTVITVTSTTKVPLSPTQFVYPYSS